MDFFSSDRSSFSRQVRLGTGKKKDDDGLFLWTAIIIILLALTAFSWIFCIYIFGHPEKAFSYNLLMRLEKIEVIKPFARTKVPGGKFHQPQELYRVYYGQNKAQLRSLSSVLRREYITNFLTTDKKKGVTYIRGNYRIYNIHELSKDDVFTKGLALRGVSEDFPEVLIEFVLPMGKTATLPGLHYDLQVNKTLQVGRDSTCAVVVNVAKAGEDKLIFTAVPIIYGNHETPAGTTIRMSAPEMLNLYGQLPITNEEISGPGAPDKPVKTVLQARPIQNK